MKPYFRLSKLGLEFQAAGKRIRKEPPFGTWMLDFRDALNRRVRQASKARTEAEAVRETLEAEDREAAIREGRDVADAFKPMLWEQVRDAYLEANAHLASLKSTRSELKCWFDPRFQKRVISSITPADCEAMLSKARKEGYALSTVKQLHLRGQIVWKFAEERLGAVRSNPWKRVPRPKVPQKRPLSLKREDVEAIFAEAGEIRFALLLAVFTGLRKGELAALRWNDFDFAAGRFGVIHARRSWSRDTTKGKKERSVPIHPAIREELMAAHARRRSDSELLFPAPRKGGIRGENAWNLARQLRGVAKRAGVTLPEKFTWHSLRSTFITHVVRQSRDLKAAQSLAGHSNLNITAGIYLAHDLEQLEDAVASVELTPRHKSDTAASSDARPRLVTVKNK